MITYRKPKKVKMSPELVLSARNIAFSGLRGTIDPGSGYRAAGGGRFSDPKNRFCRDPMIAIAQSLSVKANWKEDPNLLITPAVDTINFIHSYQKVDPENPEAGGINPHEIHIKAKPTPRLLELEKDNWPVVTHDDGEKSMVVYLAGDANATTAVAAYHVLKAMRFVNGEDAAKQQLEKWWPYLKAGLNYDLNKADINGDGLIETVPQEGEKLINQTWRDSGDAFVFGEEEVPVAPYTFFANNCFSIRRMELMAEMAGELGYDETSQDLQVLARRSRRVLHEKFWMEEEQCYTPLLDGSGNQVKIVTNESAIGIFTGVLDPEYARKAAERMLESDLLTDYGTRTRSTNDPNFRENGTKSYHRGTVWPQMDTMFVLGCDSYSFDDISSVVKPRILNLVTKPGYRNIELASISRSGELAHYNEGKDDIACIDQLWVILGIIGITATTPAKEEAIAA